MFVYVIHVLSLIEPVGPSKAGMYMRIYTLSTPFFQARILAWPVCTQWYDSREMTDKSGGEKNKQPIGIRLDKEVLELLAKASEAAGVSRTEIIEECVRAHASDYVSHIFEKRKSSLESYLKTSKGKRK